MRLQPQPRFRLSPVSSVNNKEALRRAANGAISETYPIGSVPNNTAVTSQTVYYGLVGFNIGDIVTNIHVAVGTVPSQASANCFVGIYDKLGNRLATSADLTTAADTTGMKTLALSAPYTIPADDAYFLAFLNVNAGTPPALIRGNGSSAVTGAIGSGVRNFAAQAGQSSLPTTATLGASGLAAWMGAS